MMLGMDVDQRMVGSPHKSYGFDYCQRHIISPSLVSMEILHLEQDKMSVFKMVTI